MVVNIKGHPLTSVLSIVLPCPNYYLGVVVDEIFTGVLVFKPCILELENLFILIYNCRSDLDILLLV